jgi:hypothetical protein
MTLNMILIVLLIIVGIAYFSVRNARKTRDRKQMKK